MTLPGTVADDERIRLFLALETPDDVASELRRWGRAELTGGRVPGDFHITLAFLGRRPRSALEQILGLLRRETATVGSFALEPVRYQETRSVGMLVLADPSGRATSWQSACSVGSKRSDCTSPRSAPGSRTSPCCAFVSAHGSHRRPQTSVRSLRPEPLLSFHVFTRRVRATKSWSHVH